MGQTVRRALIFIFLFHLASLSAAMGKLYEILTGVNLGAAVLESKKVFPEPRETEVIYLEKLT